MSQSLTMSMVVVMMMMVVVMMLLMVGNVEGQGCSLGDIQAVQPDIDFPMEKMDGRWLVDKVYGNPAASGYVWYSIDVVPTPTGMALLSNVRTDSDTCIHPAIELNATDSSYVYTADTEQTYSSVVVAAADSDVRHILLYWCQSTLRTAADPCLQPMVLVVGRQYAPEAAAQWLRSLPTESLPCYNDVESLTLPEGEECHVKQMVPLPGRNCNVSTFSVQENFDVTKYVSRPWKEMFWMPPPNFPPSKAYTNYIHSYTLLASGFILVDVSTRSPPDDRCLVYQTIMEVTHTPGQLLYYDAYGAGAHPYNVIDVDYDRYALVFGCVTKDNVSDICVSGRGTLWSRDVTVPRHYRLKANALLLARCVNPAAWLATPQDKPPCTSPCATGGGSSPPVCPATVTAVLMVVLLAATPVPL